MKVIEITEIEVKAALDVAKSEEVKNVLVALFCKGEKKPTPTLDDYTTIRSYEDACAALKCSPIDEKALRSAGVRKGIIALIKLETISRALWGKNYQPKPDASGNSRFYFPWFALWTEREIKETEDLVYIPVIDALNNRAGLGLRLRMTPPRMRLRMSALGFGKNQERKQSISGSNSLNCGLII